jgi:hypothetical protein
MRYTKEEYLEKIEDGDFDDSSVRNYKKCIVKVRKERECLECKRTIKAKEHAFNMRGLDIDEECYFSVYMCIDCCDEELDKIKEYLGV